MGTVAMIMILDPDKNIEQRKVYTCYLHKQLIWGTPMENAIKELLTPQEYNILTPEWHEGDEDLENHSRDPRELNAVFTIVYDYLRNNTDQYPLIHWLNKYDDQVASWSSSVSVTGSGSERWGVHGHHENMEHRYDIECELRNDKREIQETRWIAARPDIIVAGKAIRVRTETWFEYCRPAIETVFLFGRMASHRNLRLSWTVG